MSEGSSIREGESFDLTPHPRILPMLGEIVLPQPRCLAELVDNSIDGFIEAERGGKATRSPQVLISLPTRAEAESQISVRDNGPGMDLPNLERAARAGWTSHDPINNLGLFGMGFNIATARLGQKSCNLIDNNLLQTPTVVWGAWGHRFESGQPNLITNELRRERNRLYQGFVAGNESPIFF